MDFRYKGQRYQERLGSGIKKTVAKELALTIRSAVLKGERGIGRKTLLSTRLLSCSWTGPKQTESLRH